MVERLAGLRPEHEFFEKLSLISAEDAPVLEGILTRKEKAGVERLAPEEWARLVSEVFKAVAARDPLGLVDAGLQQPSARGTPSLRSELAYRVRGLG
jgi:hypothetical protein